MNRLLFIIFIFISHLAFADPNNDLSGIITDKASKEPLPGVTLYIPELKSGAVTDANGRYRINNLPQKKIVLQVSFVGYKTQVEKIDLSQTSRFDFQLEESVTEMHEVIITGLSESTERSRNAAPMTVIPQAQLFQTPSTNIIDAIAASPGMAQITTGQGISKPVIRGLGFNRIVLVHNDIRQEGQQWGDEHGIEVDEFSVGKVEILKGPASLLYGSDAMGGVINLISFPTLPDHTMKGSVLSTFQTNNGLAAYSASLSGNENGFVWDLRGGSKSAHAYKNKYDGYVFNSGFRENDASGMIGLNKSWGYTHFEYSIYNLQAGIAEGLRDSLSGKFTREAMDANGNIETRIASDTELKSFDAVVPYQNISHYKAVLNNSFIVGEGNIRAILGFQQNTRQEYGDAIKPEAVGLALQLNTFTYDLRFQLPEKNYWNISAGIGGMQQQSKNAGSEFLIPDYALSDLGLYVHAKKSIGPFNMSGGMRADTRFLQSKDLYLYTSGGIASGADPFGVQRFKAIHTNFGGLSASVGSSYEMSGHSLVKLNVSRGFRAPNISELSANGIHEGTQRYEAGNADLKPEKSLQVDLGVVFTTQHITAEANIFDNSVQDFIFMHKLNATNGNDSLLAGQPVFRFVASNANLRGGELTLDVHPHPFDWLHFENSFSMVQAQFISQPDSMRYLPFIPAARLSSDIRAQAKRKKGLFVNAFVRAGIEYTFAQNRFYKAYQTETATPSYLLMNAGFGTDIISKNKTLCTLSLSVTNLTDVAYQNHLSRLKYTDENYATGHTGVFNMGRNIIFKVLIPVELKKPKSEEMIVPVVEEKMSK